MSRRGVLRLGAGLGMAVPLSAACTGFNTSGTGGGLLFFSTQFRPAEEAQTFRGILNKAYPDEVSYLPSETAPFTTQVRTQVRANRVKVNLIGGLHGDIATLGPRLLEDLSPLAAELAPLGISGRFLELAKLGTSRTYYIPWAQATFIVAASKSALESLPSGADVGNLTYDQFLQWAKNARAANGGKPVFGLPAGVKGLLHRFIQGYLYPSFTGGMVTTFRSAEAAGMWEYFRELWQYCTRESLRYDFMQEPLAAGQVKVAWDHVARLVDAVKDKPDDWVMVPAPRGPKGLGYMAIVTGLAIPKGAKEQGESRNLINALVKPATQLDLLRETGFFPTVKASLPVDLSPAIRLEASAVTKTQQAEGSLLALAPVGMGAEEALVNKVYRDCFDSIVLRKRNIQKTLDDQAEVLQKLIDTARAPCWAPDAASNGPCQVG